MAEPKLNTPKPAKIGTGLKKETVKLRVVAEYDFLSEKDWESWRVTPIKTFKDWASAVLPLELQREVVDLWGWHEEKRMKGKAAVGLMEANKTARQKLMRHSGENGVFVDTTKF